MAMIDLNLKMIQKSLCRKLKAHTLFKKETSIPFIPVSFKVQCSNSFPYLLCEYGEKMITQNNSKKQYLKIFSVKLRNTRNRTYAYLHTF